MSNGDGVFVTRIDRDIVNGLRKADKVNKEVGQVWTADNLSNYNKKGQAKMVNKGITLNRVIDVFLEVFV